MQFTKAVGLLVLTAVGAMAAPGGGGGPPPPPPKPSPPAPPAPPAPPVINHQVVSLLNHVVKQSEFKQSMSLTFNRTIALADLHSAALLLMEGMEVALPVSCLPPSVTRSAFAATMLPMVVARR